MTQHLPEYDDTFAERQSAPDIVDSDKDEHGELALSDAETDFADPNDEHGEGGKQTPEYAKFARQRDLEREKAADQWDATNENRPEQEATRKAGRLEGAPLDKQRDAQQQPDSYREAEQLDHPLTEMEEGALEVSPTEPAAAAGLINPDP